MQFDSFSAFLDMGGYGFYVWLSFGVSAALILALIVSSVLGHKKVIKNIAIRQQREDKLRQVRKQRKNTQVDLTQHSTKEITQ
ncbi:MAG: heme exporter protein CcmD [Colwellia sp.]|nr:heme exporter protein CcmD [Colwellia sp.]MCW8864316.1 heme exporter protein CcmD [Colwellia sp.]MCW9082654.1 heme exporter protein CcmD [Colwellia sp.]